MTNTIATEPVIEMRDFRAREERLSREWRNGRTVLRGDDFLNMPRTRPAHLDRWGRFEFDREVLVLRYRAYEIDLERCTTPGRTMDYIFQISNKTWMSTEDKGDLIDALQDLLCPQATLCSYGTNKVLKDVRGYLLGRTTEKIEVFYPKEAA